MRHNAQGPAVSRDRAWSGQHQHGLIPVFALGMLCGLVLIKGEIASWFRIQEMLRFQSLHMYAFFASALATAFLGLRVVRSTRGAGLEPKQWGGGRRYLGGGLIFGVGWGLAGVCPGPIYALLGGGVSVVIVTLASALAGTVAYGVLRHRLPH